MSQRIVIMAGGTGGHVFPALAVAQNLQASGWQVSWMGTQKGLEARVVPANQIEIDWMTVEGIRGKGLLSKFKAGFKLIQACLQARRILKQRRPNLVLGMGGFVAGPGGLMARCLGIPLIVHEQNRVPGTTNRWLVKLAARQVLQAFPDSFPAAVKAKTVGNPLRAALIAQAAQARPINDQTLRILVIGGSQGAKVLNENVPAALAGLPDVEIRHQTGAVMQAEVADHYQQLAQAAEVQAFIEDMASAYAWADLIICRSGAMTVSEVAVFGLPAILVPLQNAIDDHQTANARYLADANAAVILPQTQLSPEKLREIILEVLPKRHRMREAALSLALPQATQSVADICLEVAA